MNLIWGMPFLNGYAEMNVVLRTSYCGRMAVVELVGGQCLTASCHEQCFGVSQSLLSSATGELVGAVWRDFCLTGIRLEHFRLLLNHILSGQQRMASNANSDCYLGGFKGGILSFISFSHCLCGLHFHSMKLQLKIAPLGSYLQGFIVIEFRYQGQQYGAVTEFHYNYSCTSKRLLPAIG